MKSTIFWFALTVICFVDLSQQEFTHVARICKDKSSLRCSGILIARNLVLTSGYCVNKAPQVRVFVGTSEDLCSKNNSGDHRIYTVKSSNIFKESNFHWIKDNLFYDDVAVILLPVAVQLSPTIQVANLPTSPVEKMENQHGVVEGWGLNTKLQSTKVTVHPQAECVKIFGNIFNNSQQGCVKVDKIQEMYLLDPGSPVELNKIVVGYKTNDNIIDTKSSFLVVDIYKYLSFINKIIHDHPITGSGKCLQNSLFMFAMTQFFYICVSRLVSL